MADITIPPAALEAAEKAILKEFIDMNSAADAARAAIRAALAAWPGMASAEEDYLGPACIILPLPTEKEASA